MSRLSTKNYKPRATGSLHHLMLMVICAVLLTAPYRLNYSTYYLHSCRTWRIPPLLALVLGAWQSGETPGGEQLVQNLYKEYHPSYLFGDGAVPILVHVLEDLLQRGFLAHELSKGQTSVIVSILLIKKV